MDPALGPLNLVEYSAQREKPPTPIIDIEILGEVLEELLQQAAFLINTDNRKEFLYKNPYDWNKQRKILTKDTKGKQFSSTDNSSNSSTVIGDASSETDDETIPIVPWTLIENYDFTRVVRQINDFVQTWELSPATKFVVIAQDRVESVLPFGDSYFVEVHFSKPTPKCPNPLAVAKVFFEIHISKLMPEFYPVNVTYKFEGYKTMYYVMGERKLSSNRFQRYFIDSILHMKLAFYAELSNCSNTLKPMEKLSEN